MDTNDVDYYRNRAAEEAKRASNASVPQVAQVHAQLSRSYAQRVDELTPDANDADDYDAVIAEPRKRLKLKS